MVSLKMLEPQRATPGKNKQAMATCRVSCGYSLEKVLNKAQSPVKEIPANTKDVGRYSDPKGADRTAVIAETV
jgi:hypothetical protein